jgi:predicted transcriptional regulator
MADYRLPFTGEQVEEILATATPQSSLAQETQRATEAEGQLQSNINAEAETRGNADLQLQHNINTEAETRGQADLALQQLIQQVQASLINYYLKTETYSATQIDAMLAAIKQFRYQVVDVLPTPSAETMGIIYLVPSAHAVSGNIKDEYITLTRDEGAGIIYYFEQIGETAIDLSNYYTKAQTNAEITAAINTALAAYYTSTQTDAAIAAAIATAIANYYTKSQVDALIANFITASVNNLVNYYLKSETFTKAEVNQLIAAVQQFTYQSVAELPAASADTMNKIYLVPSTNPETKNVKDEYITIAVTDQGTTTYSWEQIGTTTVDLSGYSTTEQMNAAIANAIATALANYYTKSQTMTSAEIEAAISTALASYSTTAEMNTAITAAINSALASYSTTSQMTAAIATAIANYYTKAEVDALIANFITKSVNDLVNYYLKSDTYTKTEVQQLIDAVKQFTYVSVAELPTASADTMNKIYLVPSTNPETKNVKDEYITIAVTDQGTTTYSWEQIGSTTVDLSGYYTSAQTDAAISAALNAALASYSTTSQMTAAIATAIANYYTKSEVDALIANFITKSVNDLVNYYLKSDTYTKAEVQQLIDAVKQFTYVSVAELPTASADTMNKIYLVPSTNPETKNVKDEYITIAVTDQGTTTYSWEQIGTTTVDLSGYYTSAQTDAAISAALAAYSTTTQMQSYVAGVVALYYTKTEVDALIANFITKSVNDLVNYYLKSDTYTKAEVQQLIDAVKQFTYVSVAELPTASADTMNKIYLVPSANPQTRNVKDEFITIAVTDQGTTTYSWEMIGSTEISLDNYYTKTQTDAAITAALNAALSDYSTTSQVGTIVSTAITTALANYYTKTQVDNIANTKTDKLTMTGEGAAVEDDIMVIDENGNIKDGGKKISDLQLKVTDCAMLGGGFPTCTTAGGTAAKTVTISNFLLLTNCRISVLFQNAFTASNPTLSINGGTAIAIKHFGRAMEIGKVHANTILTMVYDGTYWQVVGIESMTGSTPSGAVDLALPSGLLWCEHNVGAASPYDDGLYFSWGNVEGHTGTDGYDFGISNDGPYASTPGAALTGNISVDGTYDAARHNMGAPWRMPTQPEFAELVNNCTSEWTDEDGVAGRRFTSNINGNSIFFPACGYRNGTSLYNRGSNGHYWSSTLNSSAYGYLLYFNSGGVNPANTNYRFYGFSVRAVQ